MLSARTESSGNNAQYSDTFYNTFIYMSISLCAAVIITAAALFVHPVSRRVTDRVSFRMMIYALCGSIVYLAVPIMVDPSRDPRACGIIWSFAMLGMHFSSFLFFCIGLNLQLVMIHGVNGEQAEKFYVGGSLSLATLLGTITYFANQYKYNPDIHACWYHDADPTKGFRWQIGLQHFWYFLTMAGELITFTSIVIYMARLKVFESGPQRQSSSQGTPHSGSELSASQQYRKPIGPRQYRNIVLRIALYPLSSLATLGIMSIGSLYIFIEGMRSQQSLERFQSVLNGTYIVSLLRGSTYALVAFTDPAITRGLKVLYRHYKGRKTSLPPFNGVENTARHGDVPTQGHFEMQNLSKSANESREAAESTHRIGPGFDDSRSSFALPSRPQGAMVRPSVSRLWSLSIDRNHSLMSDRREWQIDVSYSYPEIRGL